MINLQFRNLHIDGPSVATWTDVLLRLTADFELVINNKVVYREPEFPVVELAYQLHRWLVCGANASFEYESMETEDNPLIWFRPSNTGWIVGVRHPIDRSENEVPEAELAAAAKAYLISVDDGVSLVAQVKLLHVLIDENWAAQSA